MQVQSRILTFFFFKKGVSGGPLNTYDFNFLQFHMHWGETTEAGSEHQIDRKSHAAEVSSEEKDYVFNLEKNRMGRVSD